ncbi:MAG: glycoside hydrolase family 3 protein [Anaerolineae bacterium]|nr:glycoside hydrolase family 3 protein [Anaerolineae bacterium]
MQKKILLLVLSVLLAACCAIPPPVTPVESTVVPADAVAPTDAVEPTEAATPVPLVGADPDIQRRVEDLLARMTLAEKIGQMTQVEKNSIRPEDITDLTIGSILSGGGGYPFGGNTPERWADMVDGYQEYALKTRLSIPLIYGVDAVHGHNNVKGATVFPHNIGLGATRDPELMERVGQVTAKEMIATGIYWNFGPVVAVPQDIRWGRTYEGFSEDTEVVSLLSSAYIRGLQDVGGTTDLSALTTVLATAKHYVGDGGTTWGTSNTTIMGHRFMLDQGVMEVDEATLRAVHLPPYAEAIENGAMCVMVSFSSWQDTKMHAHKYLLTDVLKGELGFQGFVVSDWAGVDQIPGNYYSDVVTSINAGVDMVMVPYDYVTFINALTEAVENGDVPMARIDDAVRRVLTVKVQLGLFEQPFSDAALLPLVGSDEHREVAREAVRKSLVLLKNEGDALPLAKDAPVIFVAGSGANDVGMQCGGWTIEWQGALGSITSGTTILQAIEDTVAEGTVVRYNQGGNFAQNEDYSRADLGIVVVGEAPYAEGVGDTFDLSLSEDDVEAIERVREVADKVVVIVISGRPLIITEQLDDCDAVVAAWLPGTEGQGVVDALFGDYPFTGRLSYTWPRSMGQVPLGSGSGEPLFPFGYGLSTEDAE